MLSRMRLPTLAVLACALAAALLGGCSSGAAHAPAARGAAADSTRAVVGPAGSHGDARVVPADPATLSRVVAAGGAPVTLVNVWATWCNPCREEMPALLEVARRHADVRLVLVSADFGDRQAEAASMLASLGVSGTTWIKTGTDQAFIDSFNRGWTGSLPATFVYDAHGRQVAFWEGRADAPKFEAAIQQAMHPQP